MPRNKRLILSFAFVAALLLGFASEGAAQYPWWGPYPYYPRYYSIDPGAAVRLEVRPKEAEVYVDGYYAGIVDDFNGVFQRLRLPPGEHEISLYRDGFRTVHQKIYLTPDHTFKIKLAMERLGPGEPTEPRPAPANPPQTGGQYPPGTAGGPGAPPTYPPARGPSGRRAPQPPQPPQRPQSAPQTPPNEPAGARTGAYGTLSLRVQPGDAEVLVDGERWRGPQGQEQLAIDVPAGRHSIQIQKPGFRSYVTEVEVRSGETTPLNVSLRAQD